MTLALLVMLVGLAILTWSAERFIEGAAVAAGQLGMSPMLVGMVIVGFGTSAPEFVVSAFAAYEGNAGIALGNAYGSNITNIALILGITAVLHPVTLHSRVVRKEIPILIAVTGLAIFQLWDGELSRADALVLIAVFSALLGWSIWEALRQRSDTLGAEVAQALQARVMPLRRAIFWLVAGLILLIASSRMLVWGAIEIAQALGVSDLIIGLTIVAVGTSLPELASSIIATRKGEHDIALGNVLGSNLFNTLAVVGLAGLIQPMPVAAEILSRDIFVMAVLTVMLFVMGYGFWAPGRVNRIEGMAFLAFFVGYTAVLALSAFH